MPHDPFKYLEEMRKKQMEKTTVGLEIKRKIEYELTSLVEKFRNYKVKI